MASLGVFFAITNADVKRLLLARQSANPDEEVMTAIEDIEERQDEKWSQETDKAWDAIHRCLTNGQLEFENGEYPLSFCVFGGAQLHDGEDYIIFLKSPEQVADVATALNTIDEPTLRERYFKIDTETYDGEISEQDFGYTWSWFQELPDFFAKAAKVKRSIIFTVDQ